MLNISGLEEGIVLDHIKAGMSTLVFDSLELEKLNTEVAIIRNAKSKKMGRKDIIKIAGGLDQVNLDILGYLDHNITVNIIKNSVIVEKRRLKLPTRIVNVLKCKNPRCITSVERGIPQIFELADAETATYRCIYCEEKFDR